MDSDSSTYLKPGQYQQTLAWLDQERINRGGSILISGLQLTTVPAANGYNIRDLATFQAINKITCFNSATADIRGLQNAIENRYTALGIDSSNALQLDEQGMKNLSAVAADRNQAVNGGTGFNFLKFQEEHLFGSGIASTIVTGFTYGALMTVYAGSGPQQTSQTNNDIIDAEVATGNTSKLPARTWNEYQSDNAGLGMTKAQMSAGWREYKIENGIGNNAGANTNYLRQNAVSQAWQQEVDLVKLTGKGTVEWSGPEKIELLETGKVEGYIGHHINNVANNPELAGNPDNIMFTTTSDHFMIQHNGNWQTPTSGELLSR